MNIRQTRILSALLALALIIASGFALAEEVEGTETTGYPYKTISCKVQNGNAQDVDMMFVYSDGMLTGSAVGLNPELAKISAIMASAAYDPGNDKMNAILGENGMGFTHYWDQNYGRDMPINDCHHVAYSIWAKEIDGCIVYCVPIRGTPSNGEWFSDFMMEPLIGDDYDGRHYGFYKAAEEVLDDLTIVVNGDLYDDAHTKIWVTGHSRGAAVANIVEAYMTEKLSDGKFNVYGYNFACPAVAVAENVSDHGNIFNYINDGDMIPTMPLSSWDYERNGHDIKKTPTSVSGFGPLFQNLAKHEYDGSSTSNPYIGLFNALMAHEDTDYDALFPFLMYAAYEAGGKNSSGLAEVYAFTNARNTLNVTQDAINLAKSNLFNPGNAVNTISTLVNIAEANWTRFNGFILFLQEGYHVFDGMDSEEIASFEAEHADRIAEIEEELSIKLTSPQDFLDAITLSDEAKSLFKNVKEEAGQVIGIIGSAVFDGHDPITYVAWVNSEYFGYRGRMNVSGATVDTETIGPECFSGDLTSLTLTDSVRCLGDKALTNCMKLTTLVVPPSVQAMGNGCLPISLVRLTVPFIGSTREAVGTKDSILYYLFGQSDTHSNSYYNQCSFGENGEQSSYYRPVEQLTELTITDTTHIQNYALKNLRSLQQITLPETLETIGNQAFTDCSGLTGIELPDSLTSIGVAAFSGCSGLQGTLVVPGRVAVLPDYVFQICSGLNGVLLQDGLTSLGKSAFSDCTGITEMVIPNSVQSLGEDCLPVSLTSLTTPFVGSSREPLDSEQAMLRYLLDFRCKGLTDVTITDATRLSYRALAGWPSLRRVTLADTVQSIGDHAFDEDTGLETINLPTGLTSIGEYAFYQCGSLESVDLPAGLTSLGFGAFSKCTGLTGVLTVPDGITELPGSVFSDCSSLEQVILPDGLTVLGDYAFHGCTGIEEMVVPKGVQRMGFYCLPTRLKKLTIPFVSPTRDGTNISTARLAYMLDRDPDTGECPLEELTITDATHILSEGCRYLPALKSVTLPDTLKSISPYAFYDSQNLTSVYYPSEALREFLPDISYVANGSLESATWYYEISDSLTLPDALSEIDDGAFCGAGAAQIILRPGVRQVGENAFADSPALRYVIVEGEDTAFAGSALAGSPNAVVVCLSGSQAAQWCEENGIPCRVK